MKKLLALFIALIFIMAGCGQEQSKTEKENANNHSKATQESKRMGDFKASINVDDDLNVYAMITYVGEANEIDIYHGGSIFFFNIYQQDGDFEYLGGMDEPELITTLIQNEPHRVDIQDLEELNLKQGNYEFEAVADFSLGPDDVAGTRTEIPVSKIKKIE